MRRVSKKLFLKKRRGGVGSAKKCFLMTKGGGGHDIIKTAPYGFLNKIKAQKGPWTAEIASRGN